MGVSPMLTAKNFKVVSISKLLFVLRR